jgi:hypothetical protein
MDEPGASALYPHGMADVGPAAGAVKSARVVSRRHLDATTLGTSTGFSAYCVGNIFFRSATLGRSL